MVYIFSFINVGSMNLILRFLHAKLLMPDYTNSIDVFTICPHTKLLISQLDWYLE